MARTVDTDGEFHFFWHITGLYARLIVPRRTLIIVDLLTIWLTFFMPRKIDYIHRYHKTEINRFL